MEGRLVFKHGTYSVRHWTPEDREGASLVVKECLETYGLRFEPQGADLDAIDVEEFYLKDNRGEFWVVIDDTSNKLIGTGGYYEVNNGSIPGTVEIRKMYLLPEARGKKLGRALLEVTPPYLLIKCLVLIELAVCSLHPVILSLSRSTQPYACSPCLNLHVDALRAQIQIGYSTLVYLRCTEQCLQERN